MATKCEVCGKIQVTGNKVSHSEIKTKRVWATNIQRVKAIVDGSTRRINVCTRCLRSGRVQRAV